MKKVLLVGEAGKTISNLKKYLSSRFDTQTCEGSVELVKGMMKVAKPDMVLICLAGTGGLDEEILEFLSDTYQNIPVLIVGSNEECMRYKDYMDGSQISSIIRPITQLQLLEKCYKLLRIENEGYEEADWGDIALEEQMRQQILIVDDSSLAIRTIKSMLDKSYDIIVAMSGEKAVEIAKKKLPDLILLDYEMPGWDGKKTLEELRNDEETKEIPVVFLTGVADRNHIEAVLGMHPEGYLLKPVDRKKLFSTIAEVFG